MNECTSNENVNDGEKRNKKGNVTRSDQKYMGRIVLSTDEKW